LSHIQNPRVDDNDVLLLIAYLDEKLVGYLGVLPEIIQLSDNKNMKCGWLSCLWINPLNRGQRIAQQLLAKCFEVWENRILVTEFTESAKGLYDKSGIFTDLQIKQGLRLYVRSDLQKLLPPKSNIFSKIGFLLKLTDGIFNFFADSRFIFCKSKPKDIRIEYINHIDEEIKTFISAKQENQLFKRGIDELNWIIKNPWILSSTTDDYSSSRYHFSSLDKSFGFYALKFYNQKNQIVAFIILSKRNKNLKVPFFYCDSQSLEMVVKVIKQHITKWKINTFTVFHPNLVEYFEKHKSPALLKKQIKRHYIVANIIASQLVINLNEIQDGDADCSFT
jgi:GNAT superfamily N-acetyltransferase